VIGDTPIVAAKSKHTTTTTISVPFIRKYQLNTHNNTHHHSSTTKHANEASNVVCSLWNMDREAKSEKGKERKEKKKCERENKQKK
jgi:hypothetical protein